jgi:hypothetical protein
MSEDDRYVRWSVCQDCLLASANGEPVPWESGSSEPEPLSNVDYGAGEEISLGWLLEWHDDQCPNRIEQRSNPGKYFPRQECDCEDLGFCQSPCQGCGSSLHGERFAMTLLLPSRDV